MNNNSKSNSLEDIISSTNLHSLILGRQTVVLSKNKLRPSYDFNMSYADINPSLTKVKYTFTLSNGVNCLWQPEARYIFLCCDQDPGVKYRKESLLITKNKSLIAKVDFTIYKVTEDMDLETFYYACDSESQESSDFAKTLEDLFELENRSILFARDEYVEFTLLQLTKEFKGSQLWIEAVNTFIDKRFNSISNIFMLLKAFPIEYTELLVDELPKKNHDDFSARQSAMIRYYTKVLNVKQVPGKVWLYKKLYGSNF